MHGEQPEGKDDGGAVCAEREALEGNFPREADGRGGGGGVPGADGGEPGSGV